MEHKEEYERDYKHAMEHPHKGVRCQSCPATYFHPILGCPSCGKYKDIYKPEVKEEDWEKLEYLLDGFFNEVIDAELRYIKGKGYGQEPREYFKKELGHWEENFKSFLKENTQRVLEDLLNLETQIYDDQGGIRGRVVETYDIKSYAKSKGIIIKE